LLKIAGVPFFAGTGEKIARAIRLCVRRQARVYRFEMLGCINQPPRPLSNLLNLIGNRRRLVRGKIVAPDISRLLEYD